MAGYEATQTAIATAFTNLVQTPLGIFVLYDNQDEQQGASNHPEDAQWVQMTIQWGDRDRIGVGEKSPRRLTGLVIAQIFTPISLGVKAPICTGDDILEALESKTISGVTYDVGRVVRVGRDRDSKSWQTNVLIPFYCDERP